MKEENDPNRYQLLIRRIKECAQAKVHFWNGVGRGGGEEGDFVTQLKSR
jgi:ABC-type Zn uptake system ZnuABC Zn-binding protein ZnuA